MNGQTPFETASENLQRKTSGGRWPCRRFGTEVLELRYGLNGHQPMTLEEVATRSASPASGSARSRTTP